MKKLILTAFGVLVVLSSNAQTLNSFLNEANAFFRKYVTNGQVGYAGLKKNKQELESLVNQIGSFNTVDLNPTEQKAFFINAYNISVINGIIKHYPTNSPLAINGFFDSKKHKIAGENITLNKLEKEYLLKATGDEKLHFVLVCAAISCPPIAEYAYRPAQLENQLLERTKMALNNAEFIRVDKTKKTVGFSEIFRWYSGDFKGKAANLIAYLNKYRSEPIPAGYKITYYPYNWTLNAQTPPVPKKDNEPASNLQVFTPSVLLRKGQVELRILNNIYTQKSTRDAEGNKVALDERQSFLNNQLTVNYGVSKSTRINFGFDILVSSFSNGKSPLSPVLWSGNTNEVALSAFGPAIRFTPFNRIPNLSIRAAFWLPGAKNLENINGTFVAHDRYTSFNQIFFDQALSPNWRLFLETDLIYRFARRKDQVDFFRVPLTGILSYFPNDMSSIYLLYQYSPRFERLSNGFVEQFGLSQWFQQVGVGFKYQVNSKLELEISYSNFFTSRREGAGETFNLSFRWLK